jgi:hypothetical protein
MVIQPAGASVGKGNHLQQQRHHLKAVVGYFLEFLLVVGA